MSTPPSAAVELLKEGHPVTQVIQWTGCSRWHLTLALHAEGMFIDRATDTAAPFPDDFGVPPWRVWARSNGWPDIFDTGALPAGVIEAYREAHKGQPGALRRAGQSHHRRSA